MEITVPVHLTAAPSEPTVTYSYDLAGRPLGFVDNSSSMVVPSTVGTIATMTSTYDRLNNATGSVWSPTVAQTAPTASSASFTHVYDRTYGESSVTSGTFRYTGARIDTETNGLYDFRARIYSPTLGRFMQADPIGYSGGINLYAYTDNDPLNQTDPSGKCPACIGAITSVAIGYGIATLTGQSYTWQNALTDAALGAIGAGIASKISTAYQLAEAGSGIAKAGYLGQLGEEAIGATGPRVGISVGGQTLFPDILGPNGIQEAKNVATIYSRDAAQISSYVDYSTANGLNPVQVFTRPGTDVSAIQGLIDAGAVEQKILPGINSLGVNSLSAADSAAIGSRYGAADSAVHSLK